MLTDKNFSRNARIYKVLGNAKRLKILNNITSRFLNIEEISKATGAKQPNLSQHLAVLRKHGLVISERNGDHVYYKIFDPIIVSNYKRFAKICN